MQKGKSLLAKIVMLCLAVTCCFALVLGATSCGNEAKDPTFAINDNGHLIVTTYDAKGEVKETKDLGSVTGLKGDKGDQGEQGPKGEDGKLEHGHEGVEFEDYELQEANCQHDGKTIRVFADGCAELLTEEGGHDFSLASFRAGEMPENFEALDLIPDEGHEECFEIDDDGNVTLNGTLTAEIKCLFCDETVEVEISLADGYRVDVKLPTHTEKGYRKGFVTYTADEVEYKDQLVEWKIINETEEHFFNGKEVEDGRTYSLEEIIELFGEDYTTFTNEVISCGESGHASFVCEECGKNILLNVQNAHKWGEAKVLEYNEEDGILLGFVCGECEEELEVYADESKYVESNCAAAAHVDWTYELEGEELSGTWNVPNAEINADAHRYVNAEGEEFVLGVNTEYRISDLDAIFDEGDYEVLGNAMNCSDTFGKATFKCPDCNKTIALERVLKDHTFELDEEESVIGEQGITLVFRCKDCHFALEPIEVEDFEIHEPVIDCQNGDDRTLTYTYNDPDGESHTETLKLGHLDANENVHKLNDNQLDLRLVHSLADLRLAFGEDLEEAGFEVLGNALSCLKTGTATFTCDVCGKKLALDIRGDHEFELIDEHAVTYDEETDEVSGELRLRCKVCEQEFDTVPYEVKRDLKLPNCKDAGYYTVTYTYMFDGEHTEQLFHKDLPADSDMHTFGERYFSENRVYTMAQIKDLFGEGNYELLGNKLTCTDEATGTVVVKCDTCNVRLGLAVTGDHDYKLVESEFYWEGKDDGVEADEGTLVSAYLLFECQVCDEEDPGHAAKFVFKGEYALVAQKLAQTNKEDGKIFVEYTYELNGVEYTKEEVLRTIDADDDQHYQGDFKFYEDGRCIVDNEEGLISFELLDELEVEYKTFANEPWYIAIACDDEDCGEILVWLAS